MDNIKNNIAVENVSFGYTGDIVLKNLDFHIQSGEMVTIIGGNGVGKSTLMKLILGELVPDSGRIKLLGEDVRSMKDFKKIGYVPQGNVANKVTFPITCKELVCLELYDDFGFIKVPKKRHKQRSEEMLRGMGLEKYIHTPVNELSGGLQQRVMIARAMINEPELLIFDEPTAGVDEKSKVHFAEVIQKLNDEYKITIVLVTHELDWVKENLKTDYIYELKNGGIVNVSI